MSLWIRTTLLAASVAATAAIGIASAGIATHRVEPAAVKADRLALADRADRTETVYLTVETRSDGLSNLHRVPAEAAD